MHLQVNSEMLANKMVSKSQYGWKTVKCFETDSLFKGLDDKDEEVNTKKFKSLNAAMKKRRFANNGVVCNMRKRKFGTI